MKKSVLFAGFMGVVLSFGGAMATDTITAASTNTVRKAVYDIQYGAASGANALDGRGYRKGVVPQTNELNNARGTNVATELGSVAVGALAEVTDGSTKATGAVDSTHEPTKSIKANTANVAVLDRDKLVTPGNGNCVANSPCGYVTVGSNNNSTDKVWMKIQ